LIFTTVDKEGDFCAALFAHEGGGGLFANSMSNVEVALYCSNRRN
jgi:hypothetical protein